MKKVGSFLFVLIACFALTACGDDVTSELDEKDTEKAEAKTGDKAAKSESSKDSTEAAKERDVWTYFEDADWSDDYNGLKSEIMKVVVTDNAPDPEDETKTKSAVGVKFKLENTTDGKFTFYPDQATLVTSTGEQIDMPDLWVSDTIGGEIDKGVIKEGNIIWFLERGEASEIKWIKMSWSGHQGGEDDFESEMKEYEVELQLK